MKTYIKHAITGILFLGLFTGLGACSDFLEEKPKSSMTTNQYFTKPDHARGAVNSLYRKGYPEFYNATSAYAGPNIMLGGYISGLFDNEYKGQEEYVRFCQSLEITPQNSVGGRMGDIWDPCYSAISRANTAIRYIGETPGLDDTEKVYLLAQAKFFRALNYFHLVKFFGDVPLLLEPYESLENLYVERTPSAEIYAQIEADLKEATAGLKDAAFTDEFRVTRYTAQALLANVYLQWSGYPLQAGRYADAASAARVVLNSGKHSLLSNGATPEASAYNALRTQDRNPEIIYAMEYNASISDGGWWPTYASTGEVEGKLFTSWVIMKNVYGVTKTVYNAYDPSDLRVAEKQYFYASYEDYSFRFEGLPTQTAPVCNWFYFEDDALLEGAKPDKDKPILRYAEVLLIAAEAIAQAEGVTSEAAGYLAQVRGRAGLPVDGLSALSKEAFIQEIWAERLREFPLEFKVWDDIQRTRKYPQTSEASRGAVTWVDVIGATNPWGATFKESNLLWPLSANEVQRNPSLTQNPGYN
jgi:hypothetical protein